MSLGLGAVMSGSWRQKLNTGSSTEAELVGINNALKYIKKIHEDFQKK